MRTLLRSSGMRRPIQMGCKEAQRAHPCSLVPVTAEWVRLDDANSDDYSSVLGNDSVLGDGHKLRSLAPKRSAFTMEIARLALAGHSAMASTDRRCFLSWDGVRGFLRLHGRGATTGRACGTA